MSVMCAESASTVVIVCLPSDGRVTASSHSPVLLVSCFPYALQLLTLASEAQREAIADESIALEAHTWIGLEAVDRKPTNRKYDFKWLSNARSPNEDWWGPGDPNTHHPEEAVCAELRGLSKELNGKWQDVCNALHNVDPAYD